MNQAILFNDDFTYNTEHGAWSCTGLISGQLMNIYFHSAELSRLAKIDNCTKFDLEEVVEIWLEESEPDANIIHVQIS